MTKEAIKEAVSESLLEALSVANQKQEDDKYSVKSVLAALVQILQIVLLPILGYLLLQNVNVQKDIVELRKDVAAVQAHLTEHHEGNRETSIKNAVIHHVEKSQKCDSCHQIRTNLNKD